MDQLVKLIMEAYGLPKKQALEIAGQVMSERQGFDDLDVKNATDRRKLAYKAETPGQGARMLLEDDAAVVDSMASGLNRPEFHAGRSPEDIMLNVAGAQGRIADRERYLQGRLQERFNDSVAYRSTRQAEAAKGMKPGTLLTPEELWPQERPGDPWGQPIPSPKPLAPYTNPDGSRMSAIQALNLMAQQGVIKL